MKRILTMLVGIVLAFEAQSQNLVGAWEAFSTSDRGEPLRNVLILSEGYQVSAWFHAKTGSFVSTNGGSWKLEGETVIEQVEFDSRNPERVGSEVSFKIHWNDSIIGIVGDDLTWKKIDEGLPGKLPGAWLISGRKRDGVVRQRDINQPRKTMKILSGTRFQWIAYHTETKQFMGTGGGTYTTIDGKYTESIEFFSRDDSRVGRNLTFDFELVDGLWHHSGLSSRGDPIYEIWTLRE